MVHMQYSTMNNQPLVLYTKKKKPKDTNSDKKWIERIIGDSERSCQVNVLF